LYVRIISKKFLIVKQGLIYNGNLVQQKVMNYVIWAYGQERIRQADSTFFQVQIFLCDLNTPLFPLILEKALSTGIHILLDHCVDLSEVIQMKFGL
jgi:hypothetical protein